METSGDPLILIGIIALFAGVFGYAIYSKVKRKSATWTGAVIDKNVTETVKNSGRSQNRGSIGISLGGNRTAINRNFNLKIRSDAEEEFNWPVGEGFYESVQVGDKLTKSPGTETPAKLA